MSQQPSLLDRGGRSFEHYNDHSSFWMTFLPPLMIPVLLAAIRPAFLPLETSLLTVDGWPICWWLPPPWGCSTGFMATPLTLGQLFLLPLALYQELAALRSGLSVLWPPAQIPTMALQVDTTVFLVPDGSLILVFLPSSAWPMMTAEVPDALAKEPLSPFFPSTFEIMVPSGILEIGRMFPTERDAI